MDNSLLSILLGLVCSWIALGVGFKFLRLLKIPGNSELEKLVFGLSLGLGIIALGIFILGIIGLFNPIYFGIWLFILFAISLTELKEIFSNILSLLKSLVSAWRGLNPIHKILFTILGVILFLISLQVLTPVWDYDGLMYHLEGPHRFLSAGRIKPIEDIYQANGPFLIEMLFSIGVSLNLAPFAKLIHFIYALILVAATFTLGNRYIGLNKGWISAVILITTPLFLIISSFAYIDIAWAVYGFLAIYTTLLWNEDRNQTWLIGSGIFTGLALGTKYLALGHAVILLLILIVLSYKQGWKFSIQNVLYFLSPAILIGSVWYLKNLIWTGNPVFPLFFGGPGWPVERVKMTNTYLSSFGTGRSLLDYLLLPWNLYFNQIKYATMESIEKLNPLFILAFGYLLVKKKSTLTLLAIVTFLGFIIWAIGSHQIRFLLPLFPGFSIISSYVLDKIVSNLHSGMIRRIIIPGLMGGFIVTSLLSAIAYYNSIQPMGVILGFERESEFLSRVEGNYSALQYLKENRQSGENVFMIWDGLSYYCDDGCLPDTDNYQWTYLVQKNKDIKSISNYLHKNQVSYLLVNITNAYFMLEHDPKGEHLDAISFLTQDFIPACAEEVYEANNIRVYKFKCAENSFTAEI